MAIPVQFVIVNRTWSVIYDDALEDGTQGETRYEEAVIAIRPGLEPLYEQHVFYHELVHAIVGTLGWETINKDEGKVDLLAAALHQFSQTANGDLNEYQGTKKNTRRARSKKGRSPRRKASS